MSVVPVGETQMKAKRGIVVLVVLGVLIPALWVVVHAADKPGGSIPQLKFAVAQRDTLRGVQGVYVSVEPLEPEVERNGLTREALRTDAELQLRRYGIKILTQDEATHTPGVPLLSLSVNVVPVNDDTIPIVAVNMQVSFGQIVALVRDPTVICTCATWDRGMTARISRARLAGVRDIVNDLVAKFINDYLAANPKEGKTKEEGAETKP